MKPNCPYHNLPRSAFWRTAMPASRGPLVPQVDSLPLIGTTTKIASAGSCFAQNIARELKRQGFSYLVSEPGPMWMDQRSRESMGYGLYSARFGNVYTAAQLLQLMDRAYGRFKPKERAWQEGGMWFDPFRPTVQAGGFASEEALEADRESHLAAVRSLFEQLDVLVFTLGLTEAWRSKADGAVFPVCPGCEVGNYDAGDYEFVNFGVGEVLGQLSSFMERLVSVNPRAQVILTVSPVALAATYSGHHVLEASTYSKSVLRVAAEEVRRLWENVHYFSSYEIVTQSRRADYFADDLRNVSPVAVADVMNAFFQLFADDAAKAQLADTSMPADEDQRVVCDEDLLAEALSLRAS